MIAQQAIDAMRDSDGIGWITVLKSASIRVLIEQGQLQLGLFDERNLVLAELGTIVRNTCRTPSAGPDAPTFNVLTTPNPKQARVLALVQTIHV